MQVLVVEDDTILRGIMIDLLKIWGFEGVGVEHGLAAIQYVNDNPPPRVILLDLIMPVMSGSEFLELREHDETLRKIPVVVLSASACYALHTADAVVSKPFRHDDLFPLISKHCSIP